MTNEPEWLRRLRENAKEGEAEMLHPRLVCSLLSFGAQTRAVDIEHIDRHPQGSLSSQSDILLSLQFALSEQLGEARVLGLMMSRSVALELSKMLVEIAETPHVPHQKDLN